MKTEQSKISNSNAKNMVNFRVKTNNLRRVEELEIRNNGQATKSARGMPWHQEPTKDAAICEKPRGGESIRYIRGYPNGETRLSNTQSSYGEYIAV